MSQIFLSYRRADSQDIADRIYDRLAQEFGSDNVFKDVDSIPLAANFRQVIKESIAGTDIFLAIIGPKWLGATDHKGNRRLDDCDDPVRVEIETALAHSISVIPITIGGASVPAASELPDTIRDISSRQGLAVRPDPDFARDAARLIRAIHKLGGTNPREGELSQHDVIAETLGPRGEIVLEHIRVKYLLDRNDADRERAVAYVEQVANEADELASIWRNIYIRCRKGARSLLADDMITALLVQTGFRSALAEFYKELPEVLTGRRDDERAENIILVLERLLAGRDLARSEVDRAIANASPVAMAGDGNTAEPCADLQSAVELIQKEAASLRAMAARLRATL